MNRIKELLKKVRQIEKCLRSSDEFHEWRKSKDRSPAEKAAASDLMLDIIILRGKLENYELDILADEFDKLKPSLDEGIAAFEKAIEEEKDFAKAINTLGNVLGLVGKVVAVAAAPSAAPLSVVMELMKARSDSDLRRVKYSLRDTELFAMPAESFVELEMPPKSSIEEKAPLFLIEEVLHGVELTKEKLIITVVSGGCTKEGDFRFDVNKRTTPYMVTVYRIVPDDCKRVPELIQISYSREELGLDGHVEFILRNKIGNTSQHRLDI